MLHAFSCNYLQKQSSCTQKECTATEFLHISICKVLGVAFTSRNFGVRYIYFIISCKHYITLIKNYQWLFEIFFKSFSPSHTVYSNQARKNGIIHCEENSATDSNYRSDIPFGKIGSNPFNSFSVNSEEFER